MHESAYLASDRFAKSLPDKPLRIADIGSYNENGCLRPLFQKGQWQYVGYDIRPGPNVDEILQGEHEWKNIPDASFDVVVSVSTMEHSKYPWMFMAQVARIVKPGGLVLIIAPYGWEYHYPPDCWRIMPDGMRAVMGYVGLKVVEVYHQGETLRGDTIGVATRPA
jgi:SAM-dependent methyltransferase